MAFIVGIVATLFANGVFPLKETLAEIWRSKTIASAVLLGLIGTVGIFQHWVMASALCVFLLCGMVVLTKFLAKDEVNERIRDAQFWIEVKLQELVNLIKESYEDSPDKDEISQLIKDKTEEIIEVTDQNLQNATWEGGKLKIPMGSNNPNKGKGQRKTKN